MAGGLDVADQYIADHADPGDVAVTADIPLAARLVDKGVFVLGAASASIQSFKAGGLEGESCEAPASMIDRFEAPEPLRYPPAAR